MFYCGGFGLFYCSEWRWGFCFRQWIWLAPPPTLPCSTGRWLRSRFCSRSLGCKLLSHMPGSRGSARDLSGVSTQNLKFLPSLTLPFLAPPLLLAVLVMLGSFYCFFIYQQDDVSVEFLLCLCRCHDDYTALGQSCKQKQTHESQKTYSKLVTPPYSLPVLVQSPKTVKRCFCFCSFFSFQSL